MVPLVLSALGIVSLPRRSLAARRRYRKLGRLATREELGAMHRPLHVTHMPVDRREQTRCVIMTAFDPRNVERL